MPSNEDMQRQQRFDQNAATIGDMFPPLWRRIFVSNIEQGFDESQSLELVKIYILSMGVAPIIINQK